MSARDPELIRLLVEELTRHEPSLSPGGDPTVARRSLHALKGSASLAGERELASALSRLERRFVGGDLTALASAHRMAIAARDALAAGQPVPIAVWPEPPADLPTRDPSTTDPRYEAEMRDRLERLDAALAGADNDRGAAAAAYREVHAMKGAALAVADDATAWFCHGLEESLRAAAPSDVDASRAVADLVRFRLVLGELVAAPDRAIAALRSVARPSLPPPSSTAPAQRQRQNTPFDADARSAEDSLRVPTSTLDKLFERVRQIGQARAHVTAGSRLAKSQAITVRQLRLDLAEALRLIGPPRPWGAPAAALARIEEAARQLAAMGERLEQESDTLKDAAERVRTEAGAAHAELAEIRTTRASWLFERVSSATLADARRQGREVRFAFVGEDTAMDRRVAEQLFDPVLQLARNAVAHGTETASERAMRSKPRASVIELAAERRSSGLRLVVRDDGAGVNLADVRARALAKRLVSPETARGADDATLLGLLFVPGFTTKDGADLLAGRGVGLDLTLEAVHRLGGTIRLASERGMGLTATLDIPFEPGLVRVMWIDADDSTYALPVQQAKRILLAKDAPDAPLLAALLGVARKDAAPHELAIELEPQTPGNKGPIVAVSGVGTVEEVALRSLSPLVRTAGPFAGAILRGDELWLCLDANLLAELAQNPG